MSFDAGVAYGEPTVELDVPPLITAIVGQVTVDDERQQLQDKANKLKFYPIVNVGVTTLRRNPCRCDRRHIPRLRSESWRVRR